MMIFFIDLKLILELILLGWSEDARLKSNSLHPEHAS